ncbi:MAG: hypothetical protein AAFU41_00855 [Pseudomonadota bacterium]
MGVFKIGAFALCKPAGKRATTDCQLSIVCKTVKDQIEPLAISGVNHWPAVVALAA